MKQLLWTVLKTLLALFMIYAGAQHFVKPTLFIPFVPAFLPYPMAIIYISGIIEILLGIALLLNRNYAKFGALGVLILMILFLPIHIWDVISDTPAIGSHSAAWIRLLFQFVLIGWSWKIYNTLSVKNTVPL